MKYAEIESRLLRALYPLWLVASAGVCAFALWVHWHTGLNNDHLALIRAGRRMLEGAVPYQDFMEINPPLISLWYMLPVWLSQVFGCSIITTFNATTIVLLALCLLASRRLLLARYSPRHANLTASFLALTWCISSFISDLYGDRTHLMVALITPWLIWCHTATPPLPHRRPGRWSLLAAVLAAFGLALKPQYYFFYALTILMRLRRTRSHWCLITWEDATILALSGAYALSLPIFFPHYFTITVPLGALSYFVLGWNWDSRVTMVGKQLLGVYAVPTFIAMLGCLLWLRRATPEMGLWLGLMLVSAASYLFGSGWWYEQFSFTATCFFATLCLTAQLISQNSSPFRWLMVYAAMWLSWQSVIHPAIERGRADYFSTKARGQPISNATPAPKAAARLNHYLEQHPKFMFIAVSMFGDNLLIEGSPRLQVGRFDYVWPLPGLVALSQDANNLIKTNQVRGIIAGAMALDLITKKPELVIVDTSPYQRGMPQGANLLEEPLKEKSFARAWQNYDRAEQVRGCEGGSTSFCAFDVYLRKPEIKQ